MIVYNEAIDEEVMEALEKCGLKSYTKITDVYGRGTASGTHLGNDIWPGRNNLLYIVCEDKKALELISCVKGLRDKFAHEGIKAFVLPIEAIT